MGNYNPILMQIALQTKKSMPSSEITKPETFAKFQDDRRRHFVHWYECYKMGNCDPILMKFDTQTKKNMLGSKVRKAEWSTASKMAAAAMLELLCYEIITGLDENWYTG
jgi:hypothetical protein